MGFFFRDEMEREARTAKEKDMKRAGKRKREVVSSRRKGYRNRHA